jgi:hypothetical protein
VAELEQVKFSDFPAAQQLSIKAHAAYETTPEIIDKSLDRLLTPVHPSRRPEVDKIVADHERELVEAIRAGNNDAVHRSLDKLFNAIAYGGFNNPKVEPLEIDRIAPRLRYFGWTGAELDLVRQLILSSSAASGTPQKKVSKINFWGLEIDGEWLSREQIRKDGMPRIWQSGERAWLSQFAPIPTMGELERRAQSSPAVAEQLRDALKVAEKVRPAKS